MLGFGGNAGVIVDEDADLGFAAQRVRVGGFAYAGQVCISVQRVFVHEKVYDDFMGLLVEQTKQVKLGDPLDRTTDVGPMIDEKNVVRVQSWVDAAVQSGARVLTGGEAQGRFYEPTIIENAPRNSFVCSREAFAPLMTVFKVSSFKQATELVNDSEFGLQAGVFTNNLEHALCDAFENIEVGGVMMNDVPAYRIDHMPYGGVKSSGLSREGIRYSNRRRDRNAPPGRESSGKPGRSLNTISHISSLPSSRRVGSTENDELVSMRRAARRSGIDQTT